MSHPIVEELRAALPVVFTGPSLDKLTGGAICWATIQNMRAKQKPGREPPPECFLRSGSGPTLVIRDAFLDWWGTTLRPAAGRPRVRQPQSRAGSRRKMEETGPSVRSAELVALRMRGTGGIDAEAVAPSTSEAMEEASYI